MNFKTIFFGDPNRTIHKLEMELPKNVCNTFKEAFTYDKKEPLSNLLTNCNYSATVLFRISQYYFKKSRLLYEDEDNNMNILSRILLKYFRLSYIFYSRLNFIINSGFTISPLADIEPPLFIMQPQSIIIGGDSKIRKGCKFYKNVGLVEKKGIYPTLKQEVTIYSNAVIIGDIVIGTNSIIGPNSVVIKDVPDNAVVSGVPAKIIKNIMDSG